MISDIRTSSAFRRTIAHGLVLCLLAFAGCSKSKSGPGTKSATEDEKPLVVETKRGPVSIVAKFDPPSPSLSDIVDLTITIKHDKNLKPQALELGDLFEEFLIADFKEGLPSTDGDKFVVEQRFRLEPMSPGQVTLDAIPYLFVSDDRDEPLVVETEPIVVQVTTMLDSRSPALADVGEPIEPMELPPSPVLIVSVIVGGIVAAIIAFLLIRRWRNRPRIEKQLTPEEIARAELSELRSSGVAQSDPKEFYVQVTGIVRRFVEATTHVRAPEQTTGEFLREMEQRKLFSDKQQEKFRVFLEAADLVKYAAQEPTDDDIEASLQTAEAFISQAPKPVQTEPEEAEPQPGAGGLGMSGFRFADPVWFIAFVAIIPSIVRLIGRRRRSAVTFSSLSIFDGMGPTWRSRVRPFVLWLRVVGLSCVVIALARPQAGTQGFRERREGIAIQICVDRSSSMSAEDFQLDGELVDRLLAVKDVIRRFVEGDSGQDLSGRIDDQIGLIAFGGYAEIRCPATLDHNVFQELLADVNLPEPMRDGNNRIIPEGLKLYGEEGATAIGDALALGVDHLRKSEAKSKVIILLSDGEHNAGKLTPDEAIQIAEEFGVRVYSIGVGSSGPRYVRYVNANGQVGYRQVMLTLDEETLRRIAKSTGGKYFHADNTDALLNVYREIDQLEKSSTEGIVYRDYRELCVPWLLAGVGLLLLEIVGYATVFRGVP